MGVYDAEVIGGGSGCDTYAIRAEQLYGNVCLIEV